MARPPERHWDHYVAAVTFASSLGLSERITLRLHTISEVGLGRVSVLLADDHQAFLRVVARHLEPHFEVVRTVGNGNAMLDEAVRLEPDVVVLDISMPGLNGIEAARRLKATGSRAKIVFLTVHADQDFVRAALGAGAVGYVLKSELASDLLTCLRQADIASPFVSPAIAGGS